MITPTQVTKSLSKNYNAISNGRNMKNIIASAAALTVTLFSCGAASASDVSQVKVGRQTANTSTATANGYYPSSSTSTRLIWGPDPAANRPAEIKELARALRGNVDLIYEYVHDNIRTVFIYGLQKGALGTLIDQSGTPFDQAQLMVELLRESGYSARYKAGTLQLNASQMQTWIGSSNANAIQGILRDGGIPLDYSSTGPTYTMGHVWVEVTIPGAACGSSCWFDPSYKSHTFKTGLNLETLMGWNANEFTTSSSTYSNGFLVRSWVGLQQQSTPVDPVWVSNLNAPNLDAKLQTYATTLLTNLKSVTHRAKEIEDVIGGQEIVRTGSVPLRNQGVLPGFTTSVQRTWDCASSTACGVPDAYRTTMTISLRDFYTPANVVINKRLFVDEIYGRRLMLDTPMNVYAPGTGGPGTFETLCIKLSVDGVALATSGSEPTVIGCTTPATKLPPIGRRYKIRLEVDHPYAASSGSYMDLSAAAGTDVEQKTDSQLPVIIMHGWGDVSPALLSKLAAEVRDDRRTPVVDPYPGPGQGYEPGEKKGDSSMDHTMTKLGASYLAQYSRMAEIQKRIGNSEHALHHMVGLVFHQLRMENGWMYDPNPGNTDNEWRIREDALRINFDAAISVNSKTDVAADRQKVIHSTIAAAGALEGSIFEQMLDAPFVSSTANRFAWGANNVANLKYYLYRPTSPAPTDGLGSDFGTAGCSQYSIYQPFNAIPAYVNLTNAFWAIAPAERCLGPGNKFGPPEGATPQPSLQRGRAFVAFKPDWSSVAHVVTDTTTTTTEMYKGGGAAVGPSYAREFDAAGAASLLKDKFEDKSNLHGIDLRTGELTYSAPADLTLGEGGFPYELSFSRSFKPGSSASPGLPSGWAHNLDIRASFSGDGMAKMGTDSAAAAAESIAAFYTAQKIYSVAPTLNSSTSGANLQTHLKRWVLAPIVMNWWQTKLNYNVVTINAGHEARQFTRFADGAFYPPRNGVGTLTQTGSRVLHEQDAQWGNEPTYDRWNYNGVSFTYQSPQKETQTFTYFEYENGYGILSSNPEHTYGRKTGWHLSNWTFPYGVSLTFNYTSNPILSDAGLDRLTSVTNNLGRTLTLGYVSDGDFGFPLLSTLSDGQGRTVVFAQPGADWRTRVLTQVTSPESGNGAETTKYDYVGGGLNPGEVLADARPQIHPKLWKVFAPSDGAYAKLQMTYDRAWRAKEMRDAVAVKTPAERGPWQFYITGTSRGERLSPAHGSPDSSIWTTYYDWRGRAIQLIDEEDRVYNQSFDNRDRMAERSFPEGNKVRFGYDDATQQVTSLVQVRKSATFWADTWADLTISATYDASCGKIKTVTDAKSQVTTWNYDSTTCVLNNIQQPQVPNPQNSNVMTTPTTSFLYNSFGQMTQITDPTSRVVSFEYDATSKYRLRRRQDPSGVNYVTTYGHNAYGDINSVNGPNSGTADTTTYTYDKMRRLTHLYAPHSQTTKNIYDLDGDVRRVERASNVANTTWQIWEKTFTPSKKTYQEISPTNAITTYAYDKLDRVDVVTDPDGRRVKTDYFRDGKTKRVIKAYQSANMAPINYATYTLTPNGQIDALIDANGNVTNYDYDGFDRLHRTFYTNPDANGAPCTPSVPHATAAPTCSTGQTYETSTYDANGNLTVKRLRSATQINWAYDNLNRETSRVVPNNPAGNFGFTLTSNYDLAGRPWDRTANSQTISHRYNTVGWLSQEINNWIGTNNTTSYAYFPSGQVQTLTYPGSTVISLTYDNAQQLNTVSESGIVLADYDWDVLARRDLVKFNNNGFSQDFKYDTPDDDLTSLEHTGPSPLTFTFLRNNSSQITSITASVGAFLAKPSVNLSQSYATNGLNQYTSVGGTALSHSATGNLLSDGTFTYEYDEENRLRKAVGGGTTALYEYDPLGRRRSKSVNGVVTKFISERDEEIEERDSSNSVLRRYVYGASVDDRIAMLDSSCAGGGRCFYLSNWQGSATTLVNQSGALIATYHYGPYGEGTNWTPNDVLTGNPFRYTGRRVDPETGLYYYRARYYSPRVGRFLQMDPIGVKDDINLYAYVDSDPVNETDPTGECPECYAYAHMSMSDDPGQREAAEALRQGLGQGTVLAIGAYGGATSVRAVGQLGRDGAVRIVSLRAAYKAATAQIPSAARLQKGSLEQQARWAFKQREVIRDGFREKAPLVANFLFRKNNRSFEDLVEGHVVKNGKSLDEAYNLIIESSAHSRGTADKVVAVMEKVLCTGSLIKKTRC